MYPGRQSEWCWRCPQCRVNKVQERSGSIFANSTLPLEKIVALFHFWAHGLPVKTTSELLSLQQNTVTNWFKVRLTSLPCARHCTLIFCFLSTESSHHLSELAGWQSSSNWRHGRSKAAARRNWWEPCCTPQIQQVKIYKMKLNMGKWEKLNNEYTLEILQAN